MDEFRRSMRQRAEERQAEWAAGRVSLGGDGIFAGIGDPVLRDSYLDAARDLLDRNRDQLPQFALPIFFLQRHALELALKEAIDTVVSFEHETRRRPGPHPDPAWGHDLAELFEQLNRSLASTGDPLPDLSRVCALVERFHDLDDRSTWARYRRDHARAELDLSAAQQDLDEVFRDLFAHHEDPDAPFGWVTEYGVALHDFITREEMEPEGD